MTHGRDTREGPKPTDAAILFADIKGYSRLTDRQHVHLFTTLWPMVNNVLSGKSVLSRNTWGDAMFILFERTKQAADAALALRDAFRSTDWEDELLQPLELRVALHRAEVHIGVNALTDSHDAVGVNIDLPARIEPIVPPNEVWVTAQFHSSLSTTGARYKCHAVGNHELVKAWGEAELYCLQRPKEAPPGSQAPVAADRLLGLRSDLEVLERMRAMIRRASETDNGFLCVAGVANRFLVAPRDERSSIHREFVKLISSTETDRPVRLLFLDEDSPSAKMREAFESKENRSVPVRTRDAIRDAGGATRQLSQRPTLKVRRTAEQPAFLMFNHEEMLQHSYLSSVVGNDMRVVRSAAGSRTYAAGQEHFENLWGHRWVLLDVGNVLVPFDHSEIGDSLHRLIKSQAAEGSRVPTASEIHAFLFEGAPGRQLSRNVRLEAGAMSWATVLSEFNAEFDVRLATEDFRSCWNSLFRAPRSGAEQIVERLQRLGVKVGLCSNTNKWHWEWLVEKHPWLRMADKLFLSHELRARKPSSDYFEAVWKRTEQPPQHHLLVDDLAENVRGAENASMRGIRFSGFEQMKAELKRLWWT